jgi:hypothetical protein
MSKPPLFGNRYIPGPELNNQYIKIEPNQQKTCRVCKSSQCSEYKIDHYILGSFICTWCLQRGEGKSLVFPKHKPLLQSLFVNTAVSKQKERDLSSPGSASSGQYYFPDSENEYSDKRAKTTRFCASCKSPQSTCWYRNRKSQPGNLCRRCYTQDFLSRGETTSDGSVRKRTCSGCGSPETTAWYKNPDQKHRFHCIRCYQKRRNSKQAKKEDKEAIRSNELVAHRSPAIVLSQ